MKTPLIAPSLLSADFANLQAACELLNDSHADWFHLDVMDGVFVPNISFGLPVIGAIKKHASKPLDVHLMIVEPDKYIAEFKKAGADILTVHYEACTHLHRVVQMIRQNGMKAGVSLNPHTPVHLLEEILPELDMVLIMSVNPGFGGQKFIPASVEKVFKLKNMKDRLNPSLLIEVDGGVNNETAVALVEAGADVLVAGSYVFGNEDPKGVIRKLKGIGS